LLQRSRRSSHRQRQTILEQLCFEACEHQHRAARLDHTARSWAQPRCALQRTCTARRRRAGRALTAFTWCRDLGVQGVVQHGGGGGIMCLAVDV
jgi:hypothetical protein